MRSSRQVFEDIKQEVRVGLTSEFHENFRRKAFFDRPWKPRGEGGWKSSRKRAQRGSLLLVTGKLRRSLKGQVMPSGVSFTSAMPYASLHNEGFNGEVTVSQHTRKETTAIRLVKGKRGLKRKRVKVRSHKVRSFKRRLRMPQRRFVGNHPKVEELIQRIVTKHIDLWREELNARLRRAERPRQSLIK